MSKKLNRNDRFKLFDRIIQISQQYPQSIKRKIKNMYVINYEIYRQSKSLSCRWFCNEMKKAFPEIWAVLLREKYKVLHTHRAGVSAKCWFLFIKGKYPTCRVCKKPTFNIPGNIPDINAKSLCSRKCSTQYAYKQIEKTNLQKYGVKNFFASSEFNKNRQKYLQQKYGKEVTGPTLVPGAAQKVRKTSLKHFGVTHFARSQEVINKRAHTCIKKYGVTCSLQSQKSRAKIKQTCLEKYGVEHPSKAKSIKHKKALISHNDKSMPINVKLTNLAKYGVEALAQQKEVYIKKLHESARRKFTLFKGHAIPYIGYEGVFIQFLNRFNNIKKVSTWYKDIPSIKYTFNGHEHIYHPDILIVLKNNTKIIIEVKSEWTLTVNGKYTRKNKAKFSQASKQLNALGYKFGLALVTPGKKIRLASKDFSIKNLLHTNDSMFVGKIYSSNIPNRG